MNKGILKTLYIIVILSCILGCKSSKKAGVTTTSPYDTAIEQALNHLNKNPKEAIKYADIALSNDKSKALPYHIKGIGYSALYSKQSKEVAKKKEEHHESVLDRRYCFRMKRELKRERRKLEDRCIPLTRARDTTGCGDLPFLITRLEKRSDICDALAVKEDLLREELDTLVEVNNNYLAEALKNYETANNILDTADKNSDSRADILLRLGGIYEELADSSSIEKGIKYFKIYIKKYDCKSKEAYYSLARLYMMQEKYRKAKKNARLAWRLYRSQYYRTKISSRKISSSYDNETCDCRFLLGMAKYKKSKRKWGHPIMMKTLNECVALRKNVEPRKKLIEIYRLTDAFNK